MLREESRISDNIAQFQGKFLNLGTSTLLENSAVFFQP